jgi:hypothetical protein
MPLGRAVGQDAVCGAGKLRREGSGEFAFWMGYRPLSPKRDYLKLTEQPFNGRFKAKPAYSARVFIFSQLSALRRARRATGVSLAPDLWH